MTAFFAFASEHPWFVTAWFFFLACAVGNFGPVIVHHKDEK